MGGILSELGQILTGGLRGARKLPGLPVARMSEGLARDVPHEFVGLDKAYDELRQANWEYRDTPYRNMQKAAVYGDKMALDPESHAAAMEKLLAAHPDAAPVIEKKALDAFGYYGPRHYTAAPGAPSGKMDRLPGLPKTSTGPAPKVVEAAEEYAKSRGINVQRQQEYGHADPTRGEHIADAYTNMRDNPHDPAVQQAYTAMADETMAQWEAVKKTGLDVDFIPEGFDPYPDGPKQVLADIKDNNHLWVFPTVSGYGTDTANTIAQQAKINPLLRPTGIKIKGHDLVVNDVFRIVHDYFGHGLEGVGFGARGEENAWRAHSRLYSKDALPAVTSETRGQNSWVNFGPHGKANRANQRNTVYADQKIGVMPEWTMRETGMPDIYGRAPVAELRDAGVGVKGPRRPLSDPRRQGIYGIPLAAGGAGLGYGVVGPSAEPDRRRYGY